jgi:hypothetical protein
MVAYALYKQSKREWLMQYEREHGTRPGSEKERVFVTAYARHELDRLREQAKNMLSAYANYVIEQAAPEIRQRAQEEYLVSRVDTTLERICQPKPLVAPGEQWRLGRAWLLDRPPHPRADHLLGWH